MLGRDGLAIAVFALTMCCGSVLADDLQMPDDWVQLSAGSAFTLRAPPGTKFQPLQGIDSFVGSFLNPHFKIEFDYGIYSNDLSEFRSDARYKTETFQVDGRAAIIITGPGLGDETWGCHGYVTAMYVASVGQRPLGTVALEMDACTPDQNELSTLHTIFRTIRFGAH